MIIRSNNYVKPEGPFFKGNDVYDVIFALSLQADEVAFSEYEAVKGIQYFYLRFGSVWVCVYPEISCNHDFEGFGIRFCNEPSPSDYEIRRSNC